VETWILVYFLRSLDDRINLRGDVVTLQSDPHVERVEVPAVTPSTREIEVRVTFREGCEGPQDSRLLKLLEEHRRGANPFPLTFGETFRRSGPNQNRDDFRNIVESYIREGRRDWSGMGTSLQALIPPLRQRLDYTSIGRRVFMVEELPEGALPIVEGALPEAETVIPAGVQPILRAGGDVAVSMGANVPFDPSRRVMGVDPGRGPDQTGITFTEVSFVSSNGPSLLRHSSNSPLRGHYPVSTSVRGCALPEWCTLGAWVARRDIGLVHRVLLIDATVVSLMRLDTGERIYWSRLVNKSFESVWKQVSDPRKTWHERLLIEG